MRQVVAILAHTLIQIVASCGVDIGDQVCHGVSKVESGEHLWRGRGQSGQQQGETATNDMLRAMHLGEYEVDVRLVAGQHVLSATAQHRACMTLSRHTSRTCKNSACRARSEPWTTCGRELPIVSLTWSKRASMRLRILRAESEIGARYAHIAVLDGLHERQTRKERLVSCLARLRRAVGQRPP